MHPIFVIDAFADRAFVGNPAAVVLLSEAADETWMQLVAAEMKHAETAFVRPIEGGYELRWFTPATEVDLCGHATLATAHVLIEQGKAGPFHFHTKSGMLTTRAEGDQIAMDFPAEAPWEVDSLSEIEELLGETPIWFGRNRMDWFAQISSEANLRSLQPDMDKVAALGLRGLLVTSQSSEYDFVSRFFAPQAGVPEDSVTGSAHCALAPFWAERLGKKSMRGYQASERGGLVDVKVMGDRVELKGKAITILEGTLRA